MKVHRPFLALAALAVGYSASAATLAYEFRSVTPILWMDASSIFMRLPSFDASLGDLQSFQLAGTIDVRADMTIRTSTAAGVGDYQLFMKLSLGPTGSPFESVAQLSSPIFQIVEHAPEADHVFVNALDASTAMSVACMNQGMCGTFPTQDNQIVFRLRPSYGDIRPQGAQIPTAVGTLTTAFTATYTYETPEPANWALVGLCLVGLTYRHRLR